MYKPLSITTQTVTQITLPVSFTKTPIFENLPTPNFLPAENPDFVLLEGDKIKVFEKSRFLSFIIKTAKAVNRLSYKKYLKQQTTTLS